MEFFDTKYLSALIVDKLESQQNELKSFFKESFSEVGVRYCIVDDLLPEDVVNYIYKNFPNTSEMRLMKSFREVKHTSKNFDEFDPVLKSITFAIQDPKVIKSVEKITGIDEQIPDPSLYAGGLSAMSKGHHLAPHIDNSHDSSRQYYRTLNLLYYVTPNWQIEYGGNLELWNNDVDKQTVISSKFNRLVIMETTPTSWHSVSKVNVDKTRCCVSNYYFSKNSPTHNEYFNVTSFSARPEQRILRFISATDNFFRSTIRKFIPNGLGKKDLYIGNIDEKK